LRRRLKWTLSFDDTSHTTGLARAEVVDVCLLAEDSVMTHEEDRLSTSTWFCLAILAVGTIIVLLTSGCAMYTDHAAFAMNPRPVVSAAQYRMAPPDVVLIASPNVRELHNHRQTISPDGKLHLPMLGSIFVAGKTCEEVSIEIERLANQYVGNAHISVRIDSFESQKIYVFGEVARPGPYVYTGTNTLLETMALAQPTRLADPQRIHVLRPDENGELVTRMTVNLDDMVKRGVMRHNAMLLDGDIIYVPANGLASIGLVFQQLLLPFHAPTTPAPASTTVIHHHHYGCQHEGASQSNISQTP